MHFFKSKCWGYFPSTFSLLKHLQTNFPPSFSLPPLITISKKCGSLRIVWCVNQVDAPAIFFFNYRKFYFCILKTKQKPRFNLNFFSFQNQIRVFKIPIRIYPLLCGSVSYSNTNWFNRIVYPG